MIIAFLHIIPLTLISLLLSFNLQAGQPGYQLLTRPTPPVVKGIYLTGYTAGLKTRRAQLIDLIKETELNSVIIDVKDSSGRVFFNTNIPLVDAIGAQDIRIPDLAELIKSLKEQGIYTIARIVVFQDPYLAANKPEIALKSKAAGLWRDRKGLAWVDPTQPLVWEYNLEIAKAAVAIGFNEINFDYIRFPSDGEINQIVYANLDKYGDKNQTMAAFYQYLDDHLQYLPVITSADLFGMVLWRSDGMGIGQRFEDAAIHFDFIAPMVYPSHYPNAFEGFANPADHPYEIIYRSLIRAKNLATSPRAQLRPWLQAFNLGAVYTPAMIRLEKQAAYDSGSQGWMLWNAANRYTASGLEPEMAKNN